MPYSLTDLQNELPNCLRSKHAAKSDALMAALKTILKAFPAAQDEWSRRKVRDPFLGAIADFQEALARARRALDVAEESFPPRVLERSSVGPFDVSNGRTDLDRLEQEMIAKTRAYGQIWRTSYWHGQQRKGRLREEPRQWLANRVGWTLQQHGIALKKGHTEGTVFSCVLRRVISIGEALETPPDPIEELSRTIDLFKYRADDVKQMSLAELGWARLSRHDPDKIVLGPAGERYTHFIYLAVPVNGEVVKFRRVLPEPSSGSKRRKIVPPR